MSKTVKVNVELSETEIYVLRVALSYYKGAHGRIATRLDERLHEADGQIDRTTIPQKGKRK